MSLDREFEKVFDDFINDEMINIWELGYMSYWLKYKDEIDFKYDYNSLFNSKVKGFIDNNKWILRNEES